MGEPAVFSHDRPASPLGVWESALRFGDISKAVTAVVELEELGYESVWLPDVGGDLFGTLGALLESTETIIVGSGVLNIWMHDGATSARRYRELDDKYPGRLIIGIGASHGPVVDMLTEPGRFNQPLAALESFIEDIKAAETVPGELLPPERMLVGALGPKAVELARRRTGGAIPYLVTPAYTVSIRERLGPDKLLYVHQAVVLDDDPDIARKIVRQNLAINFTLPNYVNSWRRCGLTDDDVAPPGSDRFVDSLVAWGGASTIMERLDAQIQAGADGVCIQIMIDRPDMTLLPLDQYRELAAMLAIASPSRGISVPVHNTSAHATATSQAR